MVRWALTALLFGLLALGWLVLAPYMLGTSAAMRYFFAGMDPVTAVGTIAFHLAPSRMAVRGHAATPSSDDCDFACVGVSQIDWALGSGVVLSRGVAASVGSSAVGRLAHWLYGAMASLPLYEPSEVSEYWRTEERYLTACTAALDVPVTYFRPADAAAAAAAAETMRDPWALATNVGGLGAFYIERAAPIFEGVSAHYIVNLTRWAGATRGGYQRGGASAVLHRREHLDHDFAALARDRGAYRSEAFARVAPALGATGVVSAYSGAAVDPLSLFGLLSNTTVTHPTDDRFPRHVVLHRSTLVAHALADLAVCHHMVLAGRLAFVGEIALARSHPLSLLLGRFLAPGTLTANEHLYHYALAGEGALLHRVLPFAAWRTVRRALRETVTACAPLETAAEALARRGIADLLDAELPWAAAARRLGERIEERAAVWAATHYRDDAAVRRDDELVAFVSSLRLELQNGDISAPAPAPLGPMQTVASVARLVEALVWRLTVATQLSDTLRGSMRLYHLAPPLVRTLPDPWSDGAPIWAENVFTMAPKAETWNTLALFRAVEVQLSPEAKAWLGDW